MDPEQLLEGLIRGVLGGRRKRSTSALRFLTGSRHSLLNAGTLLTAAGVAWGLYETVSRQGAAPPVATGASAGSPPATPAATVPPLPSVGAAGTAETEAGARTDIASVSPEVLRVIRLTIAAARADGTVTEKENEAILVHARAVGAESLVAQELQHPTPLPALIAGAPAAQRTDLYTLAFAVARGDETVSGGERIFLAQLASQLGLDAATVAELERVAAQRIAEAS
jgi:uncharacterized membrane protein YebE (DUF533 family)